MWEGYGEGELDKEIDRTAQRKIIISARPRQPQCSEVLQGSLVGKGKQLGLNQSEELGPLSLPYSLTHSISLSPLQHLPEGLQLSGVFPLSELTPELTEFDLV